LIGGINSSLGPLIGAIAYTGLQDFTARETEYWRACLGGLILALLFLLPNGLASIPSAIRTRRTKSMRFMGGS
jgi:branched-chain amino acid transport system permease protein